MITDPGVYDLSAEEYHKDPVAGGSISSSGARRILLPGCPAKFRWQADHPEEIKRHFDVGKAAHQLVLGAGPELVDLGVEELRTKAAKADDAAAREAGKLPLRSGDYAMVHEMAQALRAHPVASALFEPGTGRPEQSLVWFDERDRVWRRAMLDWLRERQRDGRLVVPDFKSCDSAAPAALSRAMAAHHYEQQAAWNEDAVTALGLNGDRPAVFLLVFQEKAEPYLITIVQPNAFAVRYGRRRNRQALQVFRRCQETGHWPGYAESVIELGLPGWAERDYLAADEAGDLPEEF